MASIHLTDVEFDQFRRRRLPVDGLVAAGDHLANCAECRARLGAHGGTAAAAALREGLGIPQDEHVSEDDLRAFVDGELDREQRAEISAHLAGCRACAEEVDDLSAFAAAFRRTTRWPASYGTLAAAAAVVLAVGGGLAWHRHAPSLSVAGLETRHAPEPRDTAVVDEALASGRLSLPPALDALRGKPGALLGDARAPAFHLISPIATVVLDTRPTLRWTALVGASAYVVTLQDEATGRTINSTRLRRAEWRPEAPLVRGGTYAWQVAASAGASDVVAPRPPDPPVRFTVANAASAARLEHLPASPLARGVVYANLGLLDDAEREFEAAAAAGENAERVNTFLAQLRRARSPAR